MKKLAQNTNNPAQFLTLLARIFGILGCVSAGLYPVYIAVAGGIFNSTRARNSEDGQLIYLFIGALLLIFLGIQGITNLTYSLRRAAKFFIAAGIVGLVIAFTLDSLLLLIPIGFFFLGGAIALTSHSRGLQQKSPFEIELAQVTELVEAGNYAEAMPRVFKLSRVNPGNPEVRLLIQKWRDHKSNSTNPNATSNE